MMVNPVSKSMKRTGRFAVIVGLMLVAFCARTNAQNASAASAASAANDAARQRPEVQVVVVPMPGGQWGVSEVYSGQVPAAKAKERLANLLKVSGWTAASPLAFEDAALDVGNVGKIGAVAPPPPVMSSVRCSLNGAVVNPAQGVINIAPFIQSLRDLNRVNIAFLMPFPAGTTYHGLEHLDSPQISVDLASRQGTYLFIANIKDHSAAPLSLAPIDQTPVALHKTGGSMLPFVFGLAVAVGLLVYFWATRLTSGSGSRK